MTHLEIIEELKTVLRTEDAPAGFASFRNYLLGRGPVLLQSLDALSAPTTAISPAATEMLHRAIRLSDETGDWESTARVLRTSIVAALSAPAAPVAGEAWVSVTERLPEAGWNARLSHPVLVYGVYQQPCIRHYEPEKETWYDAEHAEDEVRSYYTHWQPLPPAPPAA